MSANPAKCRRTQESSELLLHLWQSHLLDGLLSLCGEGLVSGLRMYPGYVIFGFRNLGLGWRDLIPKEGG